MGKTLFNLHDYGYSFCNNISDLTELQFIFLSESANIRNKEIEKMHKVNKKDEDKVELDDDIVEEMLRRWDKEK